MSSLRNSYGNITDNEIGFFIRDATLDGSLEGDSDAAVDGSSSDVKFYIQPGLGLSYEVIEVGIEISDGGSPGIDDYGNVSGPLLNGLLFFKEVDGVETIIGLPIKSNRNIINLGPTIERVVFSGNIVVANVSFNISSFSKNGVKIKGNTNDKFGIIVRDDLTSLVNHTLVVKGNITLESV